MHRDERDHQHEIVLGQRMFLEETDAEWLPGRLYFDGKCIERRSQAESDILTLMRQANFAKVETADDLPPGLEQLAQEIIDFVEYP